MGDFLEMFRKAYEEGEHGSLSTDITPSGAVAGDTHGGSSPVYSDRREQAIIDSRMKNTGNKFLDAFSLAYQERQVENRRQQRAYAEQAPPEIVEPTKQMLASRGDRYKLLEILRKMTPEQRQEALRVAPGIGQQMGDDRGGGVGRAIGALSMGISQGVSQPIMELFGAGGTQEEIDFIRELDKVAAQEFNPALPSDPWYERGPLQAAEMLPWMATTVGAGGVGGMAGKAGGTLLARGAAAGVPGAKSAFQAAGAVGRLPAAIGLKGATTKGVFEGAGTIGGITAAAFPSMYSQEVEQLRELGMEDNWKLRLLAGGTALVGGAIEGLVPNPFGGTVSLKQGAMKAARQYLWESIKKAPVELSEEYMQGVTSGLGEHIAQYIDKDANDKTISDAFAKGWEQTKEAALPMAFLLGVPAVGGAGLAARNARKYQLEQIKAKGFVSEEDAKEAGIEGANRRERMANLEAEVEQITQEMQNDPSPDAEIASMVDEFPDDTGVADQSPFEEEAGQPQVEAPLTPTPLYEVVGDENMVARVWPNREGFLVNLTDMDSGEVFPTANIFPTFEQARQYADTVRLPQQPQVAPPVAGNPFVEGEQQQGDSQQTPASFAARMARGEQMTSPEDLQYRLNNAAEIEAELQKLMSQAGSSSSQISGQQQPPVAQNPFDPEDSQPQGGIPDASAIRSPQEEVRQEEGGADLRGSGQEQVRTQPESQEPPAQAEVQVGRLPEPKSAEEVELLPKFSLYRTTMKGKKRIAVRGDGARGGGDTLHDTLEDAQRQVELDRREADDKLKRDEAFKRAQEQEAKAEQEAIASYQGFDADKPMQFSKSRKFLEKQLNFTGMGIMSRKAAIERLVGEGWKVVEEKGEKYLERPDGRGNYGVSDLGNTGIRYAEHVIALREREEGKPSDLPVPSGMEKISDWRKAVDESIESDPTRASSIMRRVASRTSDDAEAQDILDRLKDGFADRSQVAWDIGSNPKLSESVRRKAAKWHKEYGMGGDLDAVIDKDLLSKSKPSEQSTKQETGEEAQANVPATPSEMEAELMERVVEKVQPMYDTKNWNETGITAVIKTAVDAEFGALTTEVAYAGNISPELRDWINGFNSSEFTGMVRSYLGRNEAKQSEQPTTEGKTEAFRALPAKSQAKFEEEWRNQKSDSIKELLYPINKAMRAEFEARTLIKLPKTISGTKEVVEAWHRKGRKQGVTQSSKGLEPKTQALMLDKFNNIEELYFKLENISADDQREKNTYSVEELLELAEERLEDFDLDSGTELAEDLAGQNGAEAKKYAADQKRQIVAWIKLAKKELAKGESAKPVSSEKSPVQKRDDRLDELEEARLFNENFIKIVADDVSKIRKQDVYRLLSEVPNERAGSFENWLIKKRPDLAEEINEVSSELLAERASQERPAEIKGKLDEDQLPPSAIGYMMQGDRLKGEMWRSPTIGGQAGRYGAFYATNEEGAGKYSRGVGVNVVVAQMVELNNPLVVDTKQQAMEELDIDEKSLQEPSETQDIHYYIDIAIFEEATRKGYDGVVYKQEGYEGNPFEVHVFNPPDIGELPAFTVQGQKQNSQAKSEQSEPSAEGEMSVEDFVNAFVGTKQPEPKKGKKPAPAKAEPVAEEKTEYSELKQNVAGIARTIRAIKGKDVLLIEYSKHYYTWSIRSVDSKQDIAGGITDLKRAKNVAERIFSGTFDSEADKRFTLTDTQSLAYSNQKLASLWDDAGKGMRLAAALRDTGFYTDGRVLVKVSEKDRDAILKNLKIPSEAAPAPIQGVIDSAKKLSSYSDNEMSPAGYRGGDLSVRIVMLKNKIGQYAIVDKAYHDTIMKRHPTAKIWGSEDKGRSIEQPILYTVDGEPVGVLGPMQVGKKDKYLTALLEGKYEDVKPTEAVPPKKPRTLKKEPKEGVKEGLDKAKEGAKLFIEGVKDAAKGNTPFANIPMNEKIARGLGMMADGLIEAGKYKFVDFIDSVVELVGIQNARNYAKYLEAGWNKKAEFDDRLDQSQSVLALLEEKETENGIEKPKFQYGDAVARTDDATDIGRYEGVGQDGNLIVRKNGKRTNWPASKTVRIDVLVDDQGNVIESEAVDYGTVENPDRVAIGRYFAGRFRDGIAYARITDARKEAANLVGGMPADGSQAIKDIDEAIELGVVVVAREIAQSGQSDAVIYDQLVDLYERQPNLGTRTSTSMMNQAYSTPAPLAYLVNRQAGITSEDTVYDSSAGNGMLLIVGGKRFANELNEGRADSLRAQGIETTTEDATEFSIEEPISALAINPPFGEVKEADGSQKQWVIDGVRTDKVDHAITLKSLSDIPDNGKVAIIIGAKGFEQRKAKDDSKRGKAYLNGKSFYDAVYDNYNVVDHYTVSGDLYSKQGASFPVDVIIIEGRGKSSRPKPYNIVKGGIPQVFNSWEELKDAKLRPVSGVSSASAGGNKGVVTASMEGSNEGEASGDAEKLPTETPGGRVGKTDGRKPGSKGLGQPDEQPRTGNAADAERAVADEPNKNKPGRGDRGQRDADRPSRPSSSDRLKPDETAETEYQVSYSPGSANESVDTLIPRNHQSAVEKSLDSIVDLYGDIDQFVASEIGYTIEDLESSFSAEQVDAIALAIARHKDGGAFILGDQTGVGKGRVVAAMIVYANRQGLVPVFITEKPTLYADMMRDIIDIGQSTSENPFNVLITNHLSGKDVVPLPDGRKLKQSPDAAKRNLESAVDSIRSGKGLVVKEPKGRGRKKVFEDVRYGAIFTTYSQLQPVGQSTPQRAVLLKSISSSSFYILDESHNAGGGADSDPASNQERRSSGQEATITRAEIIRDLISDSAGVYFSSATYAKRPQTMGLYARTGMAAATDNDPQRLSEAIATGGVPLQQVVSEQLVESGMYLRRERSFDGVEFTPKTVGVDLTKLDRISSIFSAINEMDAYAQEAIDAIRDEITSSGGAVRDTEATGESGVDSTSFATILHNLVDQMLLALKADAVADETIKSIEAGEAPVIYVDSTLEAALKRHVEEAGVKQGDVIDFSYRDLVRRYLERSREYTIRRDVDDAESVVRIRLTDSELGPDGVAAYDKAMEMIEAFDGDMPASPIDWIRKRVSDAGYSIGEITGRQVVLDYGSDGLVRLGSRADEESGAGGRTLTVSRFNKGELDAVVINQSGSTGVSMHASEKFVNQKPRHMIIGQPARNIDTFMQALGRVHRTGQVILPRFTLMMTDAPAENRPASVLVKKLASLNANVTASAKGAVSFDVPDVINVLGDQIVAEYLAENLELDAHLGQLVQLRRNGTPKRNAGIAKKATGRMALRPVAEQTAFWDSIVESYSDLVNELNRVGKNPLVASTLDMQAKTIESTTIFEGDATSDNAFSQPASVEAVRANKPGKPMTKDEVVDAISSFYGKQVSKSVANEWVDSVLEDARVAYSEYISRQTEGLDGEDLRILQTRLRVTGNQQFENLRNRLRAYAPGTSVSVYERSSDGSLQDVAPGFVISAKRSKGGNPLVASKWSIDIAIASPDRIARTALSRTGEQEPEGNDNYREFLTNREMLSESRLKEFEETDSSPVETRHIGVGNILAAYSQLGSAGGKITFFTDSSGNVRRGVLMPRSFNLDRWANARPVVLDTLDQVKRFLDSGRYLATPDRALTANISNGKLVLIAPKAKSKGGKYTLNRLILDAASPIEFVSIGNRMEMKVDDQAKQDAVLNALLSVAALQANDPSHKDFARQIKAESESRSAEQKQLDNSLRNLPPPLYQTAPDVNENMWSEALSLSISAQDAGIKSLRDFVAYSVKTIGRDRTLQVSRFLRLAAEVAGMDGVQQAAAVSGITRDQVVTMAKRAFSKVLSEDQIETGVTLEDITAFGRNEIGFAPYGTPVPGQAMAQEDFDQPAGYEFNESDYRKSVVSWARDKWGERIAPNGKPTWQNFVRWFDDSEVVDKDGKPLTVYHGGAEAIDNNIIRTPFFYMTANKSEAQNFYPTATLHEFYVKMSKPSYVDEHLDNFMDWRERADYEEEVMGDVEFADELRESTQEAIDLMEEFKSKGSDGIIMLGEVDENYKNYLAFYPEQIKSATANVGTFDPSSPNILMQSPVQTDTADFKNRFSGSKVVNDDGSPMVVYHGTSNKFDRFKVGTAPGWGKGVYFSDNKQQIQEDFASGKDGRVIPAFVVIKNPSDGRYPGDSIVENTDAWRRMSGKWSDPYDAWGEDGNFAGEVLRELGYDGIIAKNSNNIEGLEVVAFSEDQIIEMESAPVTQSQVQTDTPAFKAWFGASKVVDEDGNPLVVYHGTTKIFTEFKEKEGTKSPSRLIGHFFSPSAEMASDHVSRRTEKNLDAAIMPVYLSITNPYTESVMDHMDMNTWKPSEIKKWKQELRDKGYDGIYIKPSKMPGYEDGVWVAFNPTQIKSATANVGTFDPNNPSILMQNQQQGGSVKGWTKFISAHRALIGATNKADFSTFIHEFFHPMRLFLLDKSVPAEKRADITDEEIETLEKYSGVKNGVWTVEAEEKAAKMWEQYWYEGISPNSVLDSLFQKISRWMREIYSGVQEITGTPLPKEIRDLFDKLVQRGLPADQRGGKGGEPVSKGETVLRPANPITSIQNEVANYMALLRGSPGLVEPESETMDEWLEEAGHRLRQDPTLGDRLVKELDDNLRAPDPIEVAVLQMHFRGLENARKAAEDRLFAARDRNDEVAAAKAMRAVDLVVNAMEEMDQVDKKIGTLQARAFVARKITLRSDFTRDALLRRGRAANGGYKLDREQTKRIEELAKQIAEVQGDLAKAEQLVADLQRQLALRQSVDDEIKQTKPRKQDTTRQKATTAVKSFVQKFSSIFKPKDDKTDTLMQSEDELMAQEAENVVKAYVEAGVYSYGELMANLRKDIGGAIPDEARTAFAKAWQRIKAQGEIPVPEIDTADASSLTKIARDIQRSLLEAGIVDEQDPKRADIVLEAVWESLREMDPDITERQTIDALSGYGQFTPLDPDEIKKMQRDINGQLLQLAKKRDLESGVRPKATGAERREMSPEERQLLREVNELKRTSKLYTEDRQGLLKSSISAALRATRNRIIDLRKAMAEGKPIVKTQVDLASQDEELAKQRKLLAEVLKEYRDMFPRPGATDAQRLAAALRATEREIARIEEQIKTKDFSPKGKAEPVTSAELRAKQAELEAVRARRDAIRAIEDPDYENRRAELALIANLKARYAEYEDRKAKGYFGPKPKKAPLQSDEITKHRRRLEEKKEEFFRLAAQWRLSKLSPKERVFDWARETSFLARAIMTSMDLSAVFRQGGPGTFAHPMLAREAAKEMRRAIFSQEVEFQIAENVRKHRLYPFAVQAKLDVTTSAGAIQNQEEAFYGRWARDGIGKKGTKINKFSKAILTPVAMSARAYTTYLNGLRFRLFVYFVDTLGANGQVTLDEAKAIANFINISTGRGNFGSFNKVAANLSTVLFAPRYLVSRFAYLGLPFYMLQDAKVSGRVKRLIAMEYARHALGVAGFLATAVALGGLLYDDDDEESPTVELDPRSTDFMKLKIGETRIDPLSGFGQIVTFMSQVGVGQKKTMEGEIVDIRGENKKYGQDSTFDLAANFLRKKLAPIPAAGVNVINGEDVVGNKATVATATTGLFIPLAGREVVETLMARGVPEGPAIAMLNILGMSGGTYGPKTKFKNANADERAKLIDKDLEAMEWNSRDPAYKDFLTIEQLERFKQRREQRKQSLVYAASANPKRKDFQDDTTYAKAVAERDKALNAMIEGKIGEEEARMLLLAYWRRNNKTLYERKGQGVVMKDALLERLRQITRKLNQK